MKVLQLDLEFLTVKDPRVCEKNFKPCVFKSNFSTIPRRKTLYATAVPSIQEQKPETSTKSIKKMNQRRLINELLEVEFCESVMVEPNEMGTSSSDAQTQTDLSLENISDLENLVNSRKHTKKSSCHFLSR